MEQVKLLYGACLTVADRYGWLAFKVMLLIAYHAYFFCALFHDYQKANTLLVLTVTSWAAIVYFKGIKIYCLPKLSISQISKERALRFVKNVHVQRLF
ncbi:unnamed protein product [Soboliphyme baturini]|uniref:Elongation of very long chain fatty acids protein n=1 Tax=Soboliphyme baturini TaxID=241478 RepID=A0A183J8B6_9BILA|nr:unnamed protein product [Soboliphyme baturini]